MKNRLYLRSALLATVLIVSFSLTAFGSKGKDKGEVGVTDTEIIIGSHQDLSGPAAAWGIQIKLGMELRVKEINDAGGIHGRKIKLVVEDNAYSPMQAITVTNKMINRDEVFAFVGNFGTITAAATLPITSRAQIPLLFPVSASSIFFEPYDRYSFSATTPFYDQARIVAKYFVEEKNKKRIGLLYQDDEMGVEVLKGLEDQLVAYDMQLVAKESYKRGATSFSTQIARLKRADVDLVVLNTVIRETVGALAEAKKLQWEVDMCGMGSVFSLYIPLLSSKAGFSADGLYAVSQNSFPYEDHANPRARAFYQNYKKLTGNEPDNPAAGGYAFIENFKTAAEAVGRDLTRERLIDELETWREKPDDIFDGITLTYTKTNHQGAFTVSVYQLQKNKWTKIKGPLGIQK